MLRSPSPPRHLTAGEKRKHNHSPDPTLDVFLKRQRRLSRSPYPGLSRSSLSDSDPDEDDVGPSTPACLDDNMDWTADAELPPNQISASVTHGRGASPSGAIHHLQLLREARPPSITAYAASSSNSFMATDPLPPKVLTMTLETRSEAYLFAVELPGYAPEAITVSCKRGNIVTVVAEIWHLPGECRQHWDIAFDNDIHTSDIRASMDKATNVLTLTAQRYRRFIPIEYQVQSKISSMSSVTSDRTSFSIRQ